jgi:hypothetical protein
MSKQYFVIHTYIMLVIFACLFGIGTCAGAYFKHVTEVQASISEEEVHSLIEEFRQAEVTVAHDKDQEAWRISHNVNDSDCGRLSTLSPRQQVKKVIDILESAPVDLEKVEQR